jgi:putative flippase GtrA
MNKSIAVHRSAVQLFRYGVVGIASNLAGYLLFLLITYLGVEPKTAMTLLYVAGATVGFFGNRRWAFSHEGTLLGAGTRYLVAHLFGYMFNFLILLTFVDMLGYSHQIVQAVAIIVVAGFLFVVFKFFVFPKKQSCKEGHE